jgi:hypothetical protein
MTLAPEGVDAETGEIVSRPVVLFTTEEAEAHTAKITATAAVLCLLVKEAHDKQAWKALGYTSWAAYVDERFIGKVSRSRSYQLIAQAAVIEGLAAETGAEVSTVVDTFPEGKVRGINAETALTVVREALMDLSPEATTADRLAVADETVQRLAVTLTTTKKAKKPKPSADAGDASTSSPASAGSSSAQDPPPAAEPTGAGEPAAPAPVTSSTGQGSAPHEPEASGGGEPESAPDPAAVQAKRRTAAIKEARRLLDMECGSAALLRKAMAELLDALDGAA